MMDVNIHLSVTLAPGEALPTEAEAVERLRELFTSAAGMTNEVLAKIWRQATTKP
jgi:hypothetical protein